MPLSPSTKIKAPPYPLDQIQETLLGELIKSVKDLAEFEGILLPKSEKELVVKAIHIDSHTVVEILCVLDEVVGFEVGQGAVRPGGYESIQEAVDDVTARMGKLWEKHFEGADA
ncbi:hypothetical protein CO671_15205 [Rhizobium sp. M10]|uniref:hypothetical protein n=1 Tax=Rhizobium sp. M10 TaxID=1324586 RepID=UPI000BE9DFFC|nr:hypothetical protein [Rhizobium sp. M10]PDT35660.1 hypothetical protein CO671_15205 [Rhizobium sp. M10]